MVIVASTPPPSVPHTPPPSPLSELALTGTETDILLVLGLLLLVLGVVAMAASQKGS